MPKSATPHVKPAMFIYRFPSTASRNAFHDEVLKLEFVSDTQPWFVYPWCDVGHYPDFSAGEIEAIDRLATEHNGTRSTP